MMKEPPGTGILEQLQGQLDQISRQLQELREHRGPTGFIPVPKWDQRYMWPTVAGLRDLIQHRNFNGLGTSGALIRHGNKGTGWLIDPDRFFEWARSSGHQLPNAEEKQ
ncbi:MAG: hypothetical protein COX57_02265 [Alphaproteobacteria bacterium CG_4_10_14_0_2_um_filter_63_37]|nr:MAG: hypothetical protein AUJ55_08410 [Proteobacteria bacterium CG1_02_64_396]PJA25646.1 MAG: hypothetical protein COX57_02265 [Alphaproteobacteria bacterium CG_4_10_14_0_2_um_filter_63_37]